MKQFSIPTFYRSPIISRVKALRKAGDPRKKDFSPTILDFGPVRILLARHFGFCYGVENAIEISYKAIDENPDKRIFLLSEMIHNPEVNGDLQSRGVRFLMDTLGNPLIPFEELNPEDLVIIPAFGTTLEIEAKLKEIGVDTLSWNTTCPFVEKVWKRADSLGESGHTIVVHGKPKHEETRATFSHSQTGGPTVVVQDMADTQMLIEFILGKRPVNEFYAAFEGKYSDGFDAKKDLEHIGVVNQTTMLASDTQAIAEAIRLAFVEKYGPDGWQTHFADTRDTLCYATNDNQKATFGLLEQGADLALVIGGYNSSNTSHLVELCEEKFPTYFISTADKILSRELISHFDIHSKTEKTTGNFLPKKSVTDIVVTSGASCPDALVEAVIHKIVNYFPGSKTAESALQELENA